MPIFYHQLADDECGILSNKLSTYQEVTHSYIFFNCFIFYILSELENDIFFTHHKSAVILITLKETINIYNL